MADEKKQTFIAKLRALSEPKKIAIIVIIVAIATAIMGYFWVKDTAHNILNIGDSLKSMELPSLSLEDDSVKNLPSVNDIVNSPQGKAIADALQNSSADQTADWKTYTNTQYGFEFSYSIKDLCPGQGGYDGAGNPTLVSLCPSSTSGTLGVSLKNERIVNGALSDAYFRDMKNPKTVSVGDKQAYQYTINQDGCSGYLTAIPVQKDEIIEVSLDDCGVGPTIDKNFPNSGLSSMNQLISTFKFTK